MRTAASATAVARGTCNACGGKELKTLYPSILRCADCSHVSADLTVEDEELRALYQREYFFGKEYRDYLEDQSLLLKNFQRRMAVLERYLSPERHRRLFEIGCAYGLFLNLVRPRFESVEGIDISPEAVAYARNDLGLKVVEGDLLRAPPEAELDVVCMWDTIEHLRDPRSYLRVVAERMRVGGLLALTTGDIGSWNARLRKENWRLIHPPTHLHYFTRASLSRLLTELGFEVVYLRSCGSYRSADSIAFQVLTLRARLPRVYHALRSAGLLNFSCYLDLGDITYLVARKR